MEDRGLKDKPPCSFLGSPGRLVSSSAPGLDRYAIARQLILELGVASTSWLQRQLSIDRAEAVQHIERMQEDGLVSLPNDRGRREILVRV